jgi:hypothetical protein
MAINTCTPPRTDIFAPTDDPNAVAAQQAGGGVGDIDAAVVVHEVGVPDVH